jgi:hypothetical protein
MSNKYFNKRGKSHIHDEDRELIKNIRLYKKFSKGALYTGAIGLGTMAISYLCFGEPNLQTLSEPISQFDGKQLVETALFSITSVSLCGGGLLYGLTNFMQQDHSDFLKKERIKNLEKDLKD